MAQTGYTPVQLYRSTTAAAVPLTANLAPGELAINIANTDMALFAENASGTVVRIMNNPVGLKYPTADGTTGQVVTTDGSGTLSFSNTAAPTNGYRRNRIINGAMQIDQRNNGASQSLTANTYKFCVDRWIPDNLGATITGQRVAGPSGYQYAYQMNGAPGVTSISFQQRIESFNVADLVDQNITISANISNSTLSTVTWEIYYPNAVDDWSAGTLISSGTWTVSPTATLYTATTNAGPNVAGGLLLNLKVGAQTSGTFKVTGVQLEPGSLATPFERQLISDTLVQCQRYYWTLGRTVFQGGATATGFGFTMTSSIQFPVTMRAAPTLTATSSGSVNMTIVGAIGAGQSGFDFYGTTNGATSPNYATMTFTNATASAEL